MSMFRPDYPSFGESNTESLRVWVSTRNFAMEGKIFLSRSMKENRRLTNLLNSDKRFLALTEVTVWDKRDAEADTTVYPFIHVNINSIEVIKPLEGEDHHDALGLD